MNLSRWIEADGRLSGEDAVGWALRLAKTLALLHRRGLAHGRICTRAVQTERPGCDADGVLLPASEVADDEAFLSAERVAGEPPTPAADVWAVGVVLYQALTGKLPFSGKAAFGQQPLVLIRAVGAEAGALQPVLDRVFHHDRAERIVTAHDLVVVLSAHQPRAESLSALELPVESIRLAHRVRHVSQPLLAAVRQEEEALPALLGEGEAEGRSEPDDDEPRRDSEAVFLGWLREPAPASEPPPDLASAADSAAPPPVVTPSDDDDDRPTPLYELMPSAPLGDEPRRAAESEPTAEPEAESELEAEPEPAHPPAAEPAPQVGREPAPPESVESTRAAEGEPGARQPKRLKASRWWLVAAVLGGLVVLFGFLGLGGPGAQDGGAPSPTALSATATLPAQQPPSKRSAEPTTVLTRPTAKASASAAATTSARPGTVDRDRCMQVLFPPDTFAADPPSFAAVCRRGHPRKGAQAIKGIVVASGNQRALTEGMREWSLLGWYEMAAFAVMHGRCCSTTIDLSHPSFEVCDIGRALEALHGAARGRADHLGAATQAYSKAATCIWSSNRAKLFQQTIQPTAQQLAYFRKTLERLPD